MRTSIAIKINSIVFLVVLALGGALGAFFAADESGMLVQELEQRIENAGNDLVADTERAASADDRETMSRILNDAVLDPEIAYVMVRSLDGEVRAARWEVFVSGGVREHVFPLRAAPYTTGPRSVEMFGPVKREVRRGPLIGSLAIGVLLGPLHEKQRALIVRTGLAVIAGAALAVFLGFFFVRMLLRQSLTPLLTGIRTIGGGELSHRIVPDPHREIEEIGRAFNEMAERLSTTLVSKEKLETAVAERTAELKVALDGRVRAQSELAEREERIRLLLDSAAEAIYGVDMSGNCTFCNPACLRMLGYERVEDLIGKNMHSLIHHSKEDGSPYPMEVCPIFAAFRTGKGNHVSDEVFWKADGSSMHVEYWSYPVFRGEARQGAVVTFLDITDRLKLEQQLVQAQKLEGIGILAGGIAHDFNNLLSPILGYTEMVLQHLGEGHPERSNLVPVLDSAKRASELTSQILAFSRKQVLQMKVVSLNSEILSAGKMIERLIGADIAVQLNLAADLPSIKADPTQMQQVLLNLAVNARDAMPQGGALTIETGIAKVDNPSLWLARGLTGDRYLLLTVSDTGTGMDEATRLRLFEPFFTTKEVGKGTGLGLSTVHGIVKQHGGDISVYSEPGRGTTFRIYLPVTEETMGPEREAPLPLLPRGSGRILLVEDDDAVRKFVEMVLTEYGYEITSVRGGADALDAAGRSAFDLVISDVIMPGMNGRDLCQRLTRLQPRTRVLYLSGYPAGSGALNTILDGGEPLLQKPFTIEALLKKVQESIAGGRDRL